METIIEIKKDEVFSYRQNDNNLLKEFEGFSVVTNYQKIYIGIECYQLCCESYGYLITNDDINDFIGSNLISISIVDSVLNNRKIDEIEYLECGEAMFVNFETSAGTLQFVAYNSHNGYYGHDAVLISKQLMYSLTL